MAGVTTREELERHFAKAFGKPLPALQHRLRLVIDVKETGQ